MVTENTIKRINELYHKSKGEGLTKEEAEEQIRLRKEYVAAFRNNLRGTLETIKIQNPDGSIIDVKQRHDEKMKNNDSKAMSVEEITAGSRIITDRLELSKEYQDNDNILIYVSYNQEVETSGIINKSLERGKKVYVPKVIINKEDRSDKYMEFVRINFYDDLQDGYMGIKEPVSDDYEIPQDGLLVMPGLAFDVTLNRIGYGGGFYDRYLVKNGDRYYKTAICFDYQVLDDIPAEEFDIRPDMIITDKRIITAQEL